MSPGPMASLGARHAEVKRLRALLREPEARAAEHAFVLEGPRLVDDALRRGVTLSALFLGPSASTAFAPLVARTDEAGIPRYLLKEGVLEKVGTTRTPQPVLAVAPMPDPSAVAGIESGFPFVVTAGTSEPGNLGTLLRSAEAAGCSGVVCCGGVDPYNPKVVRASAGAIFGVPVVERELDEAIDALRASGCRVLGTAAEAEGARPYGELDLARSVAFVLGNEAHGLPDEIAGTLDETIRIPMSGEMESLNVAVAGSILLFESARQRTARG
ncbi:MAG TPA: RNA methyltransferase [Acidimicrobiia bacterium]